MQHSSPPNSAPEVARPRRRWLARVVRAAAVLGVLGVAGAATGLWALERWVEARLPEPLDAAGYGALAKQSSKAYAADGTRMGQWWVERRTVVPGSAIPRHVRLAAVAAEDGDFYTHEGLDYPGMVRALIVNLRDGRFSQGASTITQQVARAFHLSADKTLERKVLELAVARRLDRQVDKDTILTLYLNQIYFGHGYYGIQEAARHYCGKDVGMLSVAEAASLMAAVPAPERLNPFDAPDANRARRDRVLRDMAGAGYLDATSLQSALLAPLPSRATQPRRREPPRWFLDLVRRRVEAAVGREALLTGGLRIHTTWSPHVQEALDAAVIDHLGHAVASEDSPELAAILLAPSSRHVLAVVGGRDFARAPFHRAVQARRQAGSTFKPFVVGAGLETGALTPGTTYPNARKSWRGAGGRPWAPANYDGQHDGAATTVADALARSLNVVAVQALEDVGVGPMVDFARRAGLRSPIPGDLSAALGSADVTPWELATAYAALADGGLAGELMLVTRVEAPDGRVLWAESVEKTPALPPSVTADLEAMLVDAVERGTGKRARVEGLRVAGKTGTSSGAVDAWFAGWTDRDLLGVVWVGHDDGRPLTAGSGGRTAAPLLGDVFRAVQGSEPTRDPLEHRRHAASARPPQAPAPEAGRGTPRRTPATTPGGFDAMGRPIGP